MRELCPSDVTHNLGEGGVMTVYTWNAYGSTSSLVVDTSDNSVELIDVSKNPGEPGESLLLSPYVGESDPLHTSVRGMEGREVADMDFNTWVAIVDRLLRRWTGYGVYDHDDDGTLRAAYDDEEDPVQVAKDLYEEWLEPLD